MKPQRAGNRRPILRKGFKGQNLEATADRIGPDELTSAINVRPEGGDLIPRGGQLRLFAAQVSGRIIGFHDTAGFGGHSSHNGGGGGLGNAHTPIAGSNLFSLINGLYGLRSDAWASSGSRVWFWIDPYSPAADGDRGVWLGYFAPDQYPTAQRVPWPVTHPDASGGGHFRNGSVGMGIMFADPDRNQILMFGELEERNGNNPAGGAFAAVPLPQPQNGYLPYNTVGMVGDGNDNGGIDTGAMVHSAFEHRGDWYYNTEYIGVSGALYFGFQLWKYTPAPSPALVRVARYETNLAALANPFTHTFQSCAFREHIYTMWTGCRACTATVWGGVEAAHFHRLLKTTPAGVTTEITPGVPADVNAFACTSMVVVNDKLLMLGEGSLTSKSPGSIGWGPLILAFDGTTVTVLYDGLTSDLDLSEAQGYGTLGMRSPVVVADASLGNVACFMSSDGPTVDPEQTWIGHTTGSATTRQAKALTISGDYCLIDWLASYRGTLVAASSLVSGQVSPDDRKPRIWQSPVGNVVGSYSEHILDNKNAFRKRLGGSFQTAKAVG
jgi:hypothetical protein